MKKIFTLFIMLSCSPLLGMHAKPLPVKKVRPTLLRPQGLLKIEKKPSKSWLYPTITALGLVGGAKLIYDAIKKPNKKITKALGGFGLLALAGYIACC